MGRGGIFGWDVAGYLRAILTDTTGRLLVALDAFNASLPAGTNLIGRVDARSGDKIVSYKAVYAENILNTNAAAGSNTLTGAGVPANTIRHVTHIAAYDANNNPTRILLFVNFSGVSSQPLWETAGPGAGVFTHWDGHVILRPGDNIFCTITGCVLNDDISLRACGWDESI